MTDFRGPAIDSKAFRVEGHCCGIRIPALMDRNSDGVRFDISPEIMAELLQAGIQPDPAPLEPQRTDDFPRPPPIQR